MERELTTELQLHYEREVARLVAEGASPADAHRRARLAMGSLERVKEETRDMWGVQWLESAVQDGLYALRTLRRAPGFTLVALMALAMGIGANSAIFSVVQGVLLSPLPFRDAAGLYRVNTLYPDGTPYSLSAPDFMSVRERTRTFAQVEAMSSQVVTLLGTGEPIEVRGTRVSDGLFEELGLRIALGRTLLPEETQPGRSNVVVLDHGFWLRRFGGDRGVIGRTLTFAETSMEIVGVVAPGARVLEPTDFYAPLTYDARFSPSTAAGRRTEFLTVVGRAKPGMSDESITADLRRIGSELQAAFRNTNDALTFNAQSLRYVLLGDVRAPLLVLVGAVGFVLLVACANVANLLLARTSARRAELAVRSALGAGRNRLLRQLLTEALVLGMSGAAIGLALAYVATRALVMAQPADIPRLENVGVNGPVVWFTLAVALATSLVFGTLPALQSSGASISGGLSEGNRGGIAGGGHRMRAALVVAEVALAVVLLVGAGLLVRSFVQLTQSDPGFRPEQLVSFRVTLQGERYRDDVVVRARVGEMLERLRVLPGVTSAAATSVLPLSGRGAMVGFAVEGAAPPPNVNAEIALAVVTPDYFRTVGAALRRGRQLTEQDSTDGPRVAIANEAAVRRWFPEQDPLGRRVSINGVSWELVGVVADIVQRSAADPAIPSLFVPLAQRATRSVKVVVRTGADPVTVTSAIPPVIRAVDGGLAMADFAPATDLVARTLARPRFYTSLLSLFAVVALALAATGIFGVMNYAVTQRTREISIRMALGARRATVLGAIVRRAVALALIGSGCGLVMAAVLTRVLQGQLFGVTRLDPLTFGAALVVLIASAALAAFLPARRAANLDPASSLREG